MRWKSRHIPIVMLHGVSNNKRLDDLKPWVITHESFIRLLDYIDNNGYTTAVFEDMETGSLNKKSTIITFDDCPKHLLDFAIPELLKRNMKAVFYMPTAYLGGHNEWNTIDGHSKMDLMDEDDIKKLVDSGMEVGSHAHHHIMFGEENDEIVITEFRKSNNILEEITGRKIITAAYPYGSVPSNYYSIMRGIGYSYVLSVYSINETRYSIRRWIYDDSDTVDTIKSKMSISYSYYRSVFDKYSHYSKILLRTLYNKYSYVKKSLRS